MSWSLDCPDSASPGKCSHSVSPVWLSLLSVQSKSGGSEDFHKAQVLLQHGTMGQLECAPRTAVLEILLGTTDRCVGCRLLGW